MTRLFDAVYVSTDDDEIAEVAAKYGAHALRREEALARDEVGTQEVMRAAIATLACGTTEAYGGITAACCIYATAPLMDPADLIRGYNALLSYSALYAFSVGTEPLHDAGQFYWGRPGAFVYRKPLYAEEAVIVPVESRRVCDINTEEDWAMAEEMYLALQLKVAA